MRQSTDESSAGIQDLPDDLQPVFTPSVVRRELPTGLQPSSDIPTDLRPVSQEMAAPQQQEIPNDLQPVDWRQAATDHVQSLNLDMTNPVDAGQAMGVYDAFKKVYGNAQEQADPTWAQKQIGYHQQLQQQANDSRGQLASFAIEALHPAGRVMAGIENAVAPVVEQVAPGAAQNIRQSAADLQNIRGDTSSVGGVAGGLVGNLPVMANPLLAAGVAGGETYHNIEEQKAAGANISNGAEALDVAGQAVLNGIMSRLFGKNVTGGLAKTLEAKLAAKVPALIARYGAKTAIGVGINVAQGLAANLVTQQTVNPDQDLTEGAGMNALLGAGTEVGLTALHDAFGKKPGTDRQVSRRENLTLATDKTAVGPSEVQAPPAASEQSVLDAQQEFVNLRGQLERGELEGEAKTAAEQKTDHLAAEIQTGIGDNEDLYDKLAAVKEQTPTEKWQAKLHNAIAGVKDIAGSEPATKIPSPIPDAARTTGMQKLDAAIALGRSVLSDESGAQRMSVQDIVGPGSIYHEEIKPPLQKLADAGKEIFHGIRTLFPMETGAGDTHTANVVREHFARATLDQQKAEIAFDDAKKGFDKLGKVAQWGFQSRMDSNQPQATPELQTIADEMYKDTNHGREKLIALGQDVAQGWREEWWNRLWKKDPTKAEGLRNSLVGPGKVEGRGGFMKGRSIENWSDALKQGLVPKYDNPVEMFLATRAERQKYIAGYGAMKELAGDNLIKRSATVPPGWAELDRRAAGPLKSILPGEGMAIAPEPVARVLKNVVTPSAVGGSKVFRALMATNNTITQSLLGLSGFHVRKVAQELINLNVARAIENAAHGEEGAKTSLIRAPKSPIDAISTGADVQKVMLGMKSAANPEQMQRIDAMLSGGMRAKGDAIYETQWKDRFSKALSDGGVQGLLRAVGYSPLVASEHLMQKGVFQFVQHAKLAMGYEMAGDVIKRLDAKSGPAGIPHEELRAEMSKVSDHLDNVLGMMVRDNLFWNRTTRDLATLSTLSVGWNYGSGRALAGGLYDLGKGALEVKRGGKLADVDSRRIAYLASTAALTAITGAVTTYIATGHGPKTLMDYVYPDTGDKDRKGHAVRMNTGFYTSDWFDFLHHPIDTASNKASPIIHDALALFTNKDYQGTKIRNEDDKWYQQAASVAKYLGKSSAPLSIQQLVDTIQGGGTENKSLSLKLAGFAGFKTAKKSYSMTDAENLSRELESRHFEQGGRTTEQADKSKTIAKLAGDMRNKEPDAGANFRQAIRTGAISRGDAARVRELASRPAGLVGELKDSSLTPDELMQVWKAATPDEKNKIGWIVRGRIGRNESLSPETKRQYLKQIVADVRGPQ
jgi:hypothetical protein